ncbi:MAG: hypothetical protein JJU42_01350 [Rhodobacteraceae bacterium]|nr:hypothetical protein [Paracoccaceae bacterium]
MKRILRPLALAAIALTLATPAAAQCFADYKAKQDNPLRLQYGIVELPADACNDHAAAARHVEAVLARHGWTLLQIESTFGPEGFEQRRARAGEIHLRN